VLDATDDGATIRDTKTQQEYKILKLMADPPPGINEWDEVPAPPHSP
jgi:hypothetical protein